MASSKIMPVVFIGHGNPMNALATNEFSAALGKLGRELPRPKAILCISAHWMTEGTWVTAMDQPRTIHDFYGFPPELFAVRYPAPGSRKIAERLQETVPDPRIHLDAENWGLDHGTWSVLKHMYPEANIPVLQLSIYMAETPEYHFRLGEQLRNLREQGILILGSGNIVHNLRKLIWKDATASYDWAAEFDQWAKSRLEARDFRALTKSYLETEAGKLSVPSPDHYYPLLPVLGASDKSDELRFVYEGIENGSISMRAFVFGGASATK